MKLWTWETEETPWRKYPVDLPTWNYDRSYFHFSKQGFRILPPVGRTESSLKEATAFINLYVWSFTLREKHRFSVFENRALRHTFVPKRHELTGKWKIHKQELYVLSSSPNIIRVIK